MEQIILPLVEHLMRCKSETTSTDLERNSVFVPSLARGVGRGIDPSMEGGPWLGPTQDTKRV